MIEKYRNELKKNEEVFNSCCESPSIIGGTCHNCGIEIEREYINSEPRAYNRIERRNRIMNEPRHNKTGPRTLMGGSKDHGGRLLSPKNRNLFGRLNKYNISILNSLEHNLWESHPKMKNMCSILQINPTVYSTAWSVYLETAKQKLAVGRNLEGMVCASLYIAIRYHKIPLLLDNVVEAGSISIRKIHRSIYIITQKVLPKLKIKYRPVTYVDLVRRFCNLLSIEEGKTTEIISELKEIKIPRKIAVKDQRGIAAALVYNGIRGTTNKRTQSEICSIAKITDVTLRERVKNLKEIGF